MNPPLRKLTAVVIVMFLTLMGAATYIQFFSAPELNAHPRNSRTLYRELGTERGPIIVAGESITGSEPVDDRYNFVRTYTQGPEYAHITGYFSVVESAMTGIERAENSVLGGSDDSLATQRIEELITGRQPAGGGVALTIDPKAQQAAWDALGSRRGAVVALEPDTGRILALVSKPSFDPNLLSSHDSDTVKNAWADYSADDATPLLNRATGGELYAPGSSFKILTAAAMIEDGLTADSVVDAPDAYSPPNTTHQIRNPLQRTCGDGSGQVPLRVAFTESCNTTFAMGAVDLGWTKMNSMAQSLGIGDEISIPLDVRPSRFPEPEDDAALAMDGIGQRDVQVSVLQMAMIGSAVANNGVLMTPYLVDQTLTADLGVVSTSSPREYSRPFSATTAAELEKMMIDVVNDGSGQYAALGNVQVAGKTGSAQVANGVEPHSWFVGYDAVENPQVTVAVFIENGGDGGQNAGPVARDVIDAVVNG